MEINDIAVGRDAKKKYTLKTKKSAEFRKGERWKQHAERRKPGTSSVREKK